MATKYVAFNHFQMDRDTVVKAYWAGGGQFFTKLKAKHVLKFETLKDLRDDIAQYFPSTTMYYVEKIELSDAPMACNEFIDGILALIQFYHSRGLPMDYETIRASLAEHDKRLRALV